MTNYPLSYSSAHTLRECGQKWWLEKRQRVSGPPSFATLGGTTVHMMTEKADYEDLGIHSMVETYPADFKTAFDEVIEDELNSKRNAEMGYTYDDIKAFGRKSVQWPDKENYRWWQVNGPVMVQRWRDWRKVSGWDVAVDHQGQAMIEVEFDLTLGDTQVRGRIDRVMRNRQTGALAVVDLKTGSTEPASADQLGVYGLAMREQGVDATAGMFWYGRTGGSSVVENLMVYTRPRLEAEYGIAQTMIDNNLFVPNPDKHCSYCGVRDWCAAQNGSRVGELNRPFAWVPVPATLDEQAPDTTEES
jgi:hypothetical protein